MYQMNFSQFICTMTAVILPILFLTGCQQKISAPADLPRLSPCVITVTQDGTPLEDATVTLVSIGGSKKWGPGAKTNASGVAEIYTNGFYKGAPAGKYKVIVGKTEVEPSKAPPAPGPEDPGYDDWLKKYGNEVRPVYSLVEKKFTVADTTPLEVEIQEGKTLSTAADIGKKVREKQ
jgi:hypothetical protein